MPRLKSLLDRPYVLLAIAPLFWAGNVIVGRAVRGEIPPISLNWWRWAVAALLVTLIAHRGLWRQRHLVLRSWKLLLLLAAVGLTAFHSAVYIGLTQTTAINAALMIALGPVFIVPLAWILLHERVTALQGLGVLVSLLGAVVVILRGNLAVLTGLEFNRGDLWLLFASLCWGVYSVYLKRRPAEMNELVLLAAVMLMSTALTTPLYLWEYLSVGGFAATPVSLAAIAYISVFASVLAYIFWNRGVHMVGPNKAGLFLHLIPVYVALLAALLLGERVRAYHLLGLAFIVVGIVLITRFGRPARAAGPAD